MKDDWNSLLTSLLRLVCLMTETDGFWRGRISAAKYRAFMSILRAMEAMARLFITSAAQGKPLPHITLRPTGRRSRSSGAASRPFVLIERTSLRSPSMSRNKREPEAMRDISSFLKRQDRLLDVFKHKDRHIERFLRLRALCAARKRSGRSLRHMRQSHPALQCQQKPAQPRAAYLPAFPNTS